MDFLTWMRSVEVIQMNTTRGIMEVHQFEGTLTVGGERHTFTPFPEWVSYLPPWISSHLGIGVIY